MVFRSSTIIIAAIDVVGYNCGSSFVVMRRIVALVFHFLPSTAKRQVECGKGDDDEKDTEEELRDYCIAVGLAFSLVFAEAEVCLTAVVASVCARVGVGSDREDIASLHLFNSKTV
mmetsp:Transcript_25195/g.37083  ORF Transcript_25195/g.37083 Transcript_25195/m.37083 type:complete len:116 (-) Transcript_25195:144-491(-)